jgi:capsular polysaccharide biosynthesis protein
MTAPRQTDVDAEREVDLARWRRALVALWWIPVAGLVAGAIVGVLYSFRGGATYKASALISLGQPTSPGGALVNGYGTNPRAVSQIVSSAAAQEQAAGRADMRAAALRGHVSVAQVGAATGASAARATPLISLTVDGAHPTNVAGAANALADIVVQQTTAAYVGVKIRTFRATLSSVDTQLKSVNTRLAVLTEATKAARNLDPLQQLVIVSQEDNAEARLGNLIAQQETLQQQLAFATQVESAKIVEPARAIKASAHSRNSSLLVGALIGLLIGAIVAIVGDSRIVATRSRA